MRSGKRQKKIHEKQKNKNKNKRKLKRVLNYE